MPESFEDHLSHISPEGDVLPYADIEEPMVEVEVGERSETFMFAEALITSGIAKSKENGYDELKVELTKKDQKEPNGIRVVYMTLDQLFFGNMLRRMVTDEEFAELYATYGTEGSVYREQQKAKKIGGPATTSTTALPTYDSGPSRYRDFQSAAGGDRLDDD